MTDFDTDAIERLIRSLRDENERLKANWEDLAARAEKAARELRGTITMDYTRRSAKPECGH
jgi:hypothetical protein